MFYMLFFVQDYLMTSDLFSISITINTYQFFLHADFNCQSDEPAPYGMVDRFEQLHRPSDFWRRITGGHLGVGCGKVDTGKALFFNGEGTREAVTMPLNTTFLR